MGVRFGSMEAPATVSLVEIILNESLQFRGESMLQRGPLTSQITILHSVSIAIGVWTRRYHQLQQSSETTKRTICVPQAYTMSSLGESRASSSWVNFPSCPQRSPVRGRRMADGSAESLFGAGSCEVVVISVSLHR